MFPYAFLLPATFILKWTNSIFLVGQKHKNQSLLILLNNRPLPFYNCPHICLTSVDCT